MTQEDFDEALAHRQKMLRVLRERQRVLELQAAQFGINARPEVLTEIVTLADEITRQEDDITRLRTRAAEGAFSLAEVEYRVLVAETWNTPAGRPSVVGAARLELARLQLGIKPEHAQAIERTVRVALAQEALNALDVGALLGLPGPSTPGESVGGMEVYIQPAEGGQVTIENLSVSQTIMQLSPTDTALRIVGRAIRLDPPTALQLLLACLPRVPALDVATFGPLLISVNQVAIHPDERPTFAGFLDELAAALATRTAIQAPDQDQETNHG
jgi:hypothetical protein